jgi:hypothetical protein
MVDAGKLSEAQQSAKRLDVPLEKALRMLKSCSDTNLRIAGQADQMVGKGKISLELAIRALLLAKQNGIEFEDALNVMGSVISKTQNMPSVGNPLTDLLQAAELIGVDQMSQIMQKSQDTNMSVGGTLVINRFIPRWVLNETLIALWLVKESKISRTQAEQALKLSVCRHVSIYQILFESGEYHESSGETLRLYELMNMAGILSESDFLEAFEISLSQEKPFGQVILDQGLTETPILEAACSLLDMVGSVLKPFQAAEALRQVRARNVSVYQAVAELQPPPQVPQRHLRLGDLIVEAGLIPRESLETMTGGADESPIRIGKLLMSRNLLTESTLYKALRCQSLFKEGVLSADQAVGVLSMCKDEATTLDDALAKAAIYAPSRMHWSWV